MRMSGFCGAELPAEVLFSGEEIAAIRAEQGLGAVRAGPRWA